MAEAQHEAELEAYRGRQLRDSAEAMRNGSRGSTHLTHQTDKQLSRADTRATGAYDYLQRGESVSIYPSQLSRHSQYPLQTRSQLQCQNLTNSIMNDINILS